MTIHKPLPVRIRADLYTQLEQMESAGLPFDRAINILQLSKPAHSRLFAMRTLIKHDGFVRSGERSGLFTTLEAKLIQASISAGSPARIYAQLAESYTARAQQTATMKTRMLFPAAVFLVALVIQPLPGLIADSMTVSGYLVKVLGPLILVALLAFGLRYVLIHPFASAGHKDTSPWLSVPFLGKLIARQNVSDFFSSLGSMLEAGISMLDALPIALDTITEPSIKREFARIGPRVAGGATLSEAVVDSSFLGDVHSRERVVAFINTGEQSGTLPEMLLRHTRLESHEIENSFEQLAVWAPRIVYGLVVLWILIALLSGSGLMSQVSAGV